MQTWPKLWQYASHVLCGDVRTSARQPPHVTPLSTRGQSLKGAQLVLVGGNVVVVLVVLVALGAHPHVHNMSEVPVIACPQVAS